MEMENFNHESSELPNLVMNPDITNELLLESEIKSNTKTILESVCNDFESIDVLSSKENKLVVLKKGKSPGNFSEYSNDGSDITNVTLDRNVECAPAESVFISNAASTQTNSIQNTAIDENNLDSQVTTGLAVSSLNSQNQASSDVVNSVKNIRTEMVPLQDPSALAELADAEIVQTSGNAVSLIISNPRFIQVLNCKKDSGSPSDNTLDSNYIVTEKDNFVKTEEGRLTHLSDYSLHAENTKDSYPAEVANEIVYSEEVYTHSTPKNPSHSKGKSRPCYSSSADLGKVAATRARRMTAKMKAEYLRILEEKGFLVCPLSGCFQKYRTLANFQTHYKYCYSGEKRQDLKHCPYCSSVILSAAVLHHMKIEHPEKLEEYKTNFPQPEDVYDCFEEDNTRLVEISQKSLKNHKRKLNIAKENRLSPKTSTLKNKIKGLNQPFIENSKLAENACGRFDEIVSKISSVCVKNTHTSPQAAERDENKLTKERRKQKLLLTGHVVTPEKYFEDEPEACGIIDMHKAKEAENKISTKSRLVLNMDRYKRYTEYLTITRDFGSHRKTYSKPKSSNGGVLDSSHLVTMQNDSSTSDIHQLNSSLESSSISFNENDSFCLTDTCDKSDTYCVSHEISAFDPLQSEATILSKIHLDNETKRNSLVNFETEYEREINSLKSKGTNEPIKEKIPCYKAQISVLPFPKIEPVPSCLYKSPLRISPVITFGKKKLDSIPNALKSSAQPTVDFDSLVKNSSSTNKILNSTGNMYIKHNKEDGIKHPHNLPVKRKRGRPRKDSAFVERPPVPVCKNLEKENKSISKIMHTRKDLRTLGKSVNLKSLKEQRQKSTKGRKAAKISKMQGNKISSKRNLKLLEKRRMKMVSAKSSLKKAIMCGVKRRYEMSLSLEKKRGRPVSPRVFSIKSLLKNSKLKKKERKTEYMYTTPLKNTCSLRSKETSGHNYFSSLLGICGGNYEREPSEKKVLDPSENSSKEAEFSEILPQEVTITSTVLDQPLNKPIYIQLAENSVPLTDSENRENIAQREHTPTKTLDQPTVSGFNPDLSVPSNPPTSDDKVESREKFSSHTQSPVEVKRSRGRPRKNKEAIEATPTETETKSLILDEVSSPSVLSRDGVRKSDRVRKRKHQDTPSPKEAEKAEKEKMSVNQFPQKTARRGRPRKFPRIEKDENASPHTDVRSLPLKNTPCKTTHGRRGRPRRETPKEADIFKENAENIEEMNEVFLDDKQRDGNATRGRRGRPRRETSKVSRDICVEEAYICKENVENNKEEMNEICLGDKQRDGKILMQNADSETQFILPLKKRKKVEEKINNSSICEVIAEKEVAGDEIKMTPSDKRVKGRDGSKTADDFLSKEKDPELDKLSVGVEENYIIYPNLKPDVNAFKVLSNKFGWQAYLDTSVSIKINTSCKLMELKCFDSVTLDDSKSSMFFTGGPVQSSAFCPIPSHMDQFIAVATSDFVYNKGRLDSFLYIDSKDNNKGLIQFWNLGCLQNTKLNRLPSMELAFEHHYGLISDMKWCPKGCFDLPIHDGSRMGLLALACSDSTIRVYSVPHPSPITLPKKKENTSIYNTNPSLKLSPLFAEPSSLMRRSIATCLDFHQNSEIIAAGYGNGCICVWMIKIIEAPSPTILTVKNEEHKGSILPYLIFDASGTPVTSISFVPLNNCQYLVSSSFDKTLKFFDLRDPSMPFCSLKRGMDDCMFTKDFCGALVSLHDGAIFKGSTYAKEHGTEEFIPQNILGPVGSLNSSAISNITDMQVVADITGNVWVNFFHNFCDQMKQQSYETHVIFQTEVDTMDKDGWMSVESSELNSEVSSILNDAMDVVELMIELIGDNNDSPVTPFEGPIPNSNKEVDNLVSNLESEIGTTHTVESEGSKRNMEDSSNVPNSESRRLDGTIDKKVNTISSSSDKRISLPIESNVLSSVNTISWNSNLGSHFWLFAAGNSGVARLICISELPV